jgi:RND family efflux transporter MFP subunit
MTLSFRISGYVAEVLVDEGDRVRAGQVLARLQSQEVDARLRAARADAELAGKMLRRTERLHADSVVPGARLDEARDRWEQAQATLELARYDHEQAVMRAPSDGRVLRRRAEASEFVGAGAPVLRFGATGAGWRVRLDLPDREVIRVGRGDTARLVLAALPGDTLRGTVREIADAADPASGTFDVEVAVDGPGADLRSGMVAQVWIRLSRVERLAWIPHRALVGAEGRRAAVFLVEDGRARRRPVEVVRLEARAAGVRAEAVEGHRIVTDGAAWLRDGHPVREAEVEAGEASKAGGGRRSPRRLSLEPGAPYPETDR